MKQRSLGPQSCGTGWPLRQETCQKAEYTAQISKKDLDIVTEDANCCLSKLHPLESSNVSSLSAPKYPGILLSGTPCVMCPPLQRASALLPYRHRAPNPWDQIWDNGLRPPHGNCCRAAGVSKAQRPVLAQPGRVLITANTHSRRREPAKPSRCTTLAPGRRLTGTCERILPAAGGTDSSFVSVHVSLRQKAWDSRRVRRSRCCDAVLLAHECGKRANTHQVLCSCQ